MILAYGDGFEAFMAEKITPIPGDVSAEHGGISEANRDKMRGRVQVLCNVAGVVDFNPPLDYSLEVNAFGMQKLCALAYDLGVPREEDQTPSEFLDALPEPIAEIEAEAHILTHLYVAGTYSALTLPDTVLEDLRAFWIRYERLRRKVLR